MSSNQTSGGGIVFPGFGVVFRGATAAGFCNMSPPCRYGRRFFAAALSRLFSSRSMAVQIKSV